MKCVYSNDNVAMVWHVKNMLQQHGIDVLIKNEKLYSVAGELPVTECMAEVWVKNALNYRYAEQLIAEMRTGRLEDLASWQCQDCGETVEGSFGVCWNCQGLEDSVSEHTV